MLFGGRCRMAQKSILRSRIYFYTVRPQSHAVQHREDENSFLDTIINIEEDSWISEEKIKLPEIVAPSSVRKEFDLEAFGQLEDFESPKSFDPNDIVTKTMPAFLFERNHKNIKLDHLENIRNKEHDLIWRYDNFYTQDLNSKFNLKSYNSINLMVKSFQYWSH